MCHRHRYNSYRGRCGGRGRRANPEGQNRLIDDIVTAVISRLRQPQQYVQQQTQRYTPQQQYKPATETKQKEASAAGYYVVTGKREEKWHDVDRRLSKKNSVDPPTYGEVMNNIA